MGGVLGSGCNPCDWTWLIILILIVLVVCCFCG